MSARPAAPAVPAAVAAAASEEEARASVRSLRLLLALCILVPMLVYGSLAVYHYQQVHQEAELRLDRALRIAHEHALKVFETNETLLRHVADLAETSSADGELLHLQLKELAADKPQIRTISVIDAQGRPVASSRFAQLPEGLSLADRDYFRWHAKRRGRGPVYFSELLTGKVSGLPFFDVSRGRTDRRGRFAGLVSVSLDPGYFAQFHADLGADEPGLAITMFRADGSVYSRWPPLASAPPRMAPSSPVLSRVLAGQSSGVIRGVSSLDRQDRLILFRQVGEYPVFLGTGMELAATRAGWVQDMALLGGLGVLPVLGLVIATLAAIKRARQAQDSARRLRLEAQARTQAEEALRQAQKMEAVGRLTGGVAHDFNNALMVISANLHMLKLLQPQATGKQTDAIARAVDSATKLTRQLLAFSRRQALSPERVRLQDQLPGLKDLMAPVLGRQVPLTVAVAPDTAAIEVDVAELELALINLAVNAKDAMPQGGSFRVAARNAGDGHLVEGPAVVIEATDNGGGIPPDVLPRVFEPFFTTKGVGAGTGLGLSQVYSFCQRSGGYASIRSEPGRGTTVSMFFPARDGDAAQRGSPGDAIQAPLDLRLLLVEDNAEVAAAIQPVLQALGCSVRHFSAAAPALQWLSAHAGEVDAVLTDVVMPGEMDGMALAQEVRQRHPQLRLVVMTGYAEHLEQITSQGFDVLAKPWNAASVERALRRTPAPG